MRIQVKKGEIVFKGTPRETRRMEKQFRRKNDVSYTYGHALHVPLQPAFQPVKFA